MPGLPQPEVFRGLEKLVANPAWLADPSCREHEDITEKYTLNVIGQLPRSSQQDTLDAIERARVAQKDWYRTPPKERAKVLKKFAKLTMAKRKTTLDILQAETGKARSSALEEVLDSNVNARYYANHGPSFLKTRRVRGMLPLLTKTVVHRKPKGVVGVVAPWNYPFTLAISDALAAIMAGNAVVLKPDSKTPYVALRAAQLMYEAGLPRDIFQVVTGQGAVVGDTLAHNCDYLMFTGSSRTGSHLGEITGKRLIGYSAELGGKNAMIIQSGADLDNVANVCMRAMFANSGQLCISIERVYVERIIYKEFLEKLIKRLEKLVIAADYSFSTEFGSIISENQIRTIEGHINDAVEKGAKIVYGGHRLPEIGPLFFSPTIMTDVPENATAFSAETFGPLVSVYPVDSMEEAIERANATDYGLNSSVFGRSWSEGEAIAAQLNTGTVSVNEGYAAGWESVHAPMGGQGISGVSHRHGPDGLLKYTESTTVATQRVINMDGFSFIPYATWQKMLPFVSKFISV